jgi:hypothetical protein
MKPLPSETLSVLAADYRRMRERMAEGYYKPEPWPVAPPRPNETIGTYHETLER